MSVTPIPNCPQPPTEPSRTSRKKTPTRLFRCIFLVLAVLVLSFAFSRLIPPAPVPDAAEDVPSETATEAPADWRGNLMMAMPTISFNDVDRDLETLAGYPVFDSGITRREIGSVTFLSTLADAPDDAWDVSATQNRAVLAWAVKNGGLYDLFIGAEGGINGALASPWLFTGYPNVTRIDFGDSFHTEQAEDMSYMFFGCTSLESMDLRNFDTSNVTNMAAMFWRCSALTALDLTGFSTENVRSMSHMFSDCTKLEHLDISGFDTTSLQTTRAMFQSCHGLTALDLAHFDTSHVTSMRYMFSNCSGLTELDLTGFSTGRVQDMEYMFYNCSSLVRLDLSHFSTGRVQNMKGMFSDCSILSDLDISGFYTGNVTDMSWMFSKCPGISVEDVRHFDTGKVTEYSNFMSGTEWESLFTPAE